MEEESLLESDSCDHVEGSSSDVFASTNISSNFSRGETSSESATNIFSPEFWKRNEFPTDTTSDIASWNLCDDLLEEYSESIRVDIDSPIPSAEIFNTRNISESSAIPEQSTSAVSESHLSGISSELSYEEQISVRR